MRLADADAGAVTVEFTASPLTGLPLFGSFAFGLNSFLNSCRSKSELCASVNAVAFIDDNEAYIHEVAHSFIGKAAPKAAAAAGVESGAAAGEHTEGETSVGAAAEAVPPASLPHSDPGAVILFGRYAWQHSHKPEAAAAGTAPVMPPNVRRAHTWREVQGILMSLLPSAAAAAPPAVADA